MKEDDDSQNKKNEDNSKKTNEQKNVADAAKNMQALETVGADFRKTRDEAEKLLAVIAETQNRLKMFYSLNESSVDPVQAEETEEFHKFLNEQFSELTAIAKGLSQINEDFDIYQTTLAKNTQYFSDPKSDQKIVKDYIDYQSYIKYTAQQLLKQSKEDYMKSFYACQEVIAPDDLTLRAHKSNALMINTLVKLDKLDKMYEDAKDCMKKPTYNTVRKRIDSDISRLCVDLDNSKKIEQDLMRMYKGQILNGYPVVWDGHGKLPTAGTHPEIASIIDINNQNCEAEENFCSENTKRLHLDNAVVENRRKD